jgi:hypothetical protein
MEVKVNICKIGREKNYAVEITDTSTDYLPESSTESVFQKFKKSEVKSIDVIQHNNVLESKIVNTLITNVGETNTIEITFDGWFIIYHIILPTKEWFDASKAAGGMFYTYDTIYFTDGTNFYKYKDTNTTEVSIEEIIDRNPLNTTISSVCKNHFSVFYLMHCYIRLAEKLLTANIRCETDQLRELTFNRDVI